MVGHSVSLIAVLITFVNVSEIGEFLYNIFKTFSMKKSNILINMRLSFNASGQTQINAKQTDMF